MQVVTPMALVLNSLVSKIKTKISDTTMVFDPSLEYHEVVRGIRALRHSLELQDYTTFPILAFNRTPIIPMEDGPSRRVRTLGDQLAGNAPGYKVRMCETELRFKIFFNDVVLLDTFEVLYANHESFRSIKDFTLTIEDLGEYQFFIDWKEFEGNEFTKIDGVFMSLDFSAKVWGNFLITDVSEKVILEINSTIENYLEYEFASNQIVP